MSITSLVQLVALARYREQRQRLFPSDGSLQWFLRQNRAALINAGALLLIAGRYQVDADKFDAYVLTVGAEAAKKQLELRT